MKKGRLVLIGVQHLLATGSVALAAMAGYHIGCGSFQVAEVNVLPKVRP